MSGRLRPGDRLTETELAAQLGTSRAPVREALRQLEYEGLVANRPYCATEVVGITQEEIEEVLVPIRITLERFAFSKALPNLTSSEFAALQGLVLSLANATASGDVDELAELDVRFHELVIMRAEQPHCLQLWRSIEPRVRAHFRRDAPAHARLTEVADQHQELLDALQSRDEAKVLSVLESHIRTYLVIDAG